MPSQAKKQRDRPGSLRLWPGALLAILLVAVRFGLPAVRPETGGYAILGGMLAAFGIFGWWLVFSRVPWLDRLGALGLVGFGLLVSSRIIDESLAGAGMGVLFFLYAVPTTALALVVGAGLGRSLGRRGRRVTVAATILLSCGAWALVRTAGITGNADSDFAWRWTPTPEERLLARADARPLPSSTPSIVTDAPAAWPGFRGPDRDSVVRGVRIETDWSASPPEELWRRPIGPGWSSFAVRGNAAYTQEQRGDHEIVSAYHVDTGEPIWRHRDETRFWESNGGPGPRGTPLVEDGVVYALGATGILNALDAEDGSVMWSRDAGADAGVEIPVWGFASSPVVADDLVIVAAAGTLVAYDIASGAVRWVGPSGGGGYSSPHLASVDGTPQVLLMSGAGLTSVAPATGEVLWEHPWKGSSIVQPVLLENGDLLISTGGPAGGIGTRRISVTRSADGWSTTERWTSIRLRPYFNDFVVHEGHAYGFDGGILACMDATTGERVWKGGRYGHGQLLLLADQDLLLVLSERGELALVEALPDGYRELARMPVLEGKTWNHPVLVDDVLLIRNGQEMAAMRLAGESD